MGVLDFTIIVFALLETVNVLVIYFWPEFQYGNGVAVFKQWTKSKTDNKEHLFARYMANWVAGSKLVFIALLLVIYFTAGDTTKFYTIVAMIPAVATYYLFLHPIIKKLDDMDEVAPKGYSKILLSMISAIISLFALAAVFYLMQGGAAVI